MPVDKKAKYYQWFMEKDPRNRIIGFEWHPAGDSGVESNMTVGRMTFIKRDEPGDTWTAPVEVAEEITWQVAQALAKREGFHVEVAVTD